MKRELLLLGLLHMILDEPRSKSDTLRKLEEMGWAISRDTYLEIYRFVESGELSAYYKDGEWWLFAENHPND